jgi:hypothetical protein
MRLVFSSVCALGPKATFAVRFCSFPLQGGRLGWGSGGAYWLYPHPNPPPARGRESMQTFATQAETRSTRRQAHKAQWSN